MKETIYLIHLTYLTRKLYVRLVRSVSIVIVWLDITLGILAAYVIIKAIAFIIAALAPSYHAHMPPCRALVQPQQLRLVPRNCMRCERVTH